MIGVVADDTTGALDIGVMFHRNGRSVQLLTHPWTDAVPPGYDVTIVDTDSRLEAPAEAAARVRAATRLLHAAGCTRFHKKTCSVFRGNVGAEFDALLDALREPCMVVSGAYPLVGRTTRDGQQRVHGTLLQQSAFAHDPVHPRVTSEIARMISEQSTGRVAVVPISVVRSGHESLRLAIAAHASQARFIVVDGETQSDLEVLAEATRDVRVLGGSAGLAAEWKFPGPSGNKPGRRQPMNRSTGTLVVCGSLMPESRHQVAHLLQGGIAHAEWDPRPWLANGMPEMTDAGMVEQAANTLERGESFLLFTKANEGTAVEIATLAGRAGLARAEIGRRVSVEIARWVRRIFSRVSPRALVVAGGDTSGSICRALGLQHAELWEEIEPGVPLCYSPGLKLPFVLKSGSFGSREFLSHALERCARPQASALPLAP